MEYILANKEILILAVIGVVIALFVIVKVVQKVGLERIRGEVYQLFLDAEHDFQEGQNEEKFEYVINMAKTFIPAPFNLFITETLLRKAVQAWFDLVKDLLDDGKMNGTGGAE